MFKRSQTRSAVEAVLQEIVWALGKLKSIVRCHQTRNIGDDTAIRPSSSGEGAAHLEAALHQRMASLVKILDLLANTNYRKWALTERNLRLVTKLFRQVKVATKLVRIVMVQDTQCMKLTRLFSV